MYNRYIPQTDGSYSRRTVPSSQKEPHKQPQVPLIPSPAPSAPPPPDHPPKLSPVPGFLRNLLPKEFDTGDLLIVLLLLLMAGDSEEEKNNALLTLALYFFM